MKKTIIMLALLMGALCPAQKAAAQADEIAQLLLNLEKLRQFKQILADMKSGYQILEGGYNNIRDISQGNFNLHKAFLDGLLQVSPTVRNYSRVGDIIEYQLLIVKEYKAANQRFRQDGNFTVQELAYLEKVYNNLFKESLRNLDELSGVMTAGKLRMSDDERLKEIDRIYADMQDKLTFLRVFNNKTTVLAIQRAKEKNDAVTMRKLYGINN